MLLLFQVIVSMLQIPALTMILFLTINLRYSILTQALLYLIDVKMETGSSDWLQQQPQTNTPANLMATNTRTVRQISL